MKRNRGKRARGEREKEEKFEANQKDVNTLKFSDEPCEKEGETCYVIFFVFFFTISIFCFCNFCVKSLKAWISILISIFFILILSLVLVSYNFRECIFV